MPVYSHMLWIWSSSIAWRAEALPGMLVRSLTLAPADCIRMIAILPSRMFSEKFFDPTEMLAPSRRLASLSGPASVPVGT